MCRRAFGSFEFYFRLMCGIGLAGLFWLSAPILRAAEYRQGAAVPDQIHLAWTADPARSMTVVWRTLNSSTPSEVQFRPAGGSTWATSTGGLRPSGTGGTLHEVTLTGLIPATRYEYRVRGDASDWSAIYSFRTAPVTAPAVFDAVYVADTGLVGRTDGLATGTQQVIDEIAALNPLVILPGGDYAYFNTEGDRFNTLNEAIDAWFNQMQPVAAQSPLMPTYGNHEVFLGENVEDWLQRFPTPAGYNGRRFYSFDIGDVHFISIFAPAQITDQGALNWLDQDIAAAIAAGKRWVIPYFHMAPFADGTNHSSSQSLRNSLGPIFEKYNIPLVLTSHDQAYERTWPLADAAGAALPTTMSHRTCLPLSEGVTWIKVSPGGKLSNISWGFSPFGTQPAPGWSSVRSNYLHQFARLRFGGDGSLKVEIWGVVGDGSPPALIDRFTLTDSCAPELMVDQPAVDLKLFNDETAEFAVQVTHSLGAAENIAVVSDQPWLQPQVSSGVTPATAEFIIDPSGLAPGQYAGHIQISPASLQVEQANILVTLTVRGSSGPYQIYFSSSFDRLDPQSLHDQQIIGDLFAFTLPENGSISQVRFFVDDQKHQRESSPPYDLAGTSSGRANPFDTTQLSQGEHTVSAVIVDTSGSTNTAAARFSILYNPVAVRLQETRAAVYYPFQKIRWLLLLIMGVISLGIFLKFKTKNT